MTTEDTKETIHRITEECFNEGDVDALERYAHPEMVDHYAPPDGVEGVDAVKAFFRTVLHAFSDLDYEVDDIVAEGDRAAWRATFRATHTGDFLGIPPTGKRVELEEVHYARFQDGKVIEHWAQHDTLALLQQLGVSPPAPAPTPS